METPEPTEAAAVLGRLATVPKGRKDNGVDLAKMT